MAGRIRIRILPLLQIQAAVGMVLPVHRVQGANGVSPLNVSYN